MGKTKIKGIIFDCWGTLFFDDYEVHPFKEFCLELGSDMDKDYDCMKLFESCFMLRKVDNSDEAILEMLKKQNKNFDDAKIKRYASIIAKVGRHQKEYPDALATLSDFKSNYSLAMITNTYCESFEHLKKKFKLEDIFDHIITSYETGHLKPDSHLFKVALKRMKLKPKEVIMVGDSIKDDFLAAKELGINAVLIDRKNKYPHISPRIESLNQLKEYI